jgi:NTP pyrophosphatase (non-canonical NTP hydrolase)
MTPKKQSLAEIQMRVLNFEESHKLKATPEVRVLDLLSELGEVAKELVKGSNYGKEKLSLDRDKWEMELGDVFYGIITLSNGTHVDLEQALDKTIRKMEARIVAKGHPGSE